MLLNFGKHDAGAQSVDRAGGNEDDIALRNRTPLNQLDDRAVPDGRPQFLRRDPMLQADADLGVRFCRYDVPCLALAIRHPHRARERIVRMDLDGQRLACEQQLEQQGRNRSVFVGPLEPQLPHGITCTVDAAPWLEIIDPPGLVNDPYGGMFDGHILS